MSTRAASRRSCRACSRRSSTSASNATASSMSPTSSAPPSSSRTMTRTRRTRTKAGGRGNGRPEARRQDVTCQCGDGPPTRASRPGAREAQAGPKGRGQADVPSAPTRATSRPRHASRTCCKEGQEILVQVAKEPLGTKGARLTSHVTLPGRFLVFMPTVDHIGVSRKIASREERARLRGIVREFREQHDFSGGVIIRTAAEERSKDDILADLQYFYRIWTDMRQKMEIASRAGGGLPRAEPRRQAAARPADRRLHRHPHRPPAGAPARPRVHRAHHAVARRAG